MTKDIKIGYEKDSQFTVNNIAKIFRTLTKNLYPDPLSSTIIELVSNARDSMVEAKKEEDPIILSFDKMTRKVSVKDFGIGMSPEFMKTKYIDVGYSSKENDPESIGRYGIGRLSVLSYVPSYELFSTYEGVKTHYLISSNEEGTPDLDELKFEKVDEPNGVEVIFTLKNKQDSWQDKELNNLSKIIKEKLPFFYTLIIEGLDIQKDYKIFEYNNFKVIENNSKNCIVQENCTYPINNSALTNSKDYPIAYSFKMTDSIEPTPDRTSLRWTSETIKIVQDKINKGNQELEALYLKEKETKNIFKSFYTSTSFYLHGNYISSLRNVNIYSGYKFSKGLLNLLPHVDKLFPIKQYKTQTKLISGSTYLDSTYSIKQEDFNKYKNHFQDKKFIVIPNFKELLYEKNEEKVLKPFEKEIRILEKHYYNYVKSVTKDAYTLIIPKTVKTITNRVSRKNQIWSKKNNWNYAWRDIDKINFKKSLYILSNDFKWDYLRIPYYDIYQIKENQLNKIKDKMMSVEEYLKLDIHKSFYNRSVFRQELKKYINIKSIADTKVYPKKYKLSSIFNQKGKLVDFNYLDYSHSIFLNLLSKYHTFEWQPMLDNLKKQINPTNTEFQNIYHYYFKTKFNKKCLN